MLVEKTGHATFRVVADDKAWTVYPSEYLTPQQVKQMSFQPDMILQFAHFLRDEFEARGHDVSVYAEVWVSLNGRESQRLIDSSADLAEQPHGLGARAWILSEK